MVASTRADPVRNRILAAATAEFSRYGVAGARIDRIAKAAKTSKERVYAYFASKEALYRFVTSAELAAVTAATHMDPADLPKYAGRIHDYFTSHPERFRLMTWGQLELTAGRPSEGDPVPQSVGRKVEQLRQAQETGQLDPAWDPLDILVFVNQIATSWAAQPDLAPAAGQERESFLAARRVAIVAAVQRLFPATVRESSADGAL